MEDMRSDTAGLPLQDRLIGALIGIARAVDGNEHLIAASTDEIVREGLAAAAPGTGLGNDRLSALIQRAADEKRKLIPLCYECAAPCGKNDDPDMRRLRTADEDTRSLRSLILCGIRCLAVHACRAAALGRTDRDVDRFFYQALFAIGEESFGPRELLPIAMKFGEVELRCLALLDGSK